MTSRATVDQAAADAAALLRAAWSDMGLPVDPVKIARNLGMEVYVSAMDQTLSGALTNDGPGGSPTIYLNADDAPNRRRFTCAHELGHYQQRVASGTHDQEFIDRRDLMYAKGTSEDEAYANAFAAELLMPTDLVTNRFAEFQNPVSMAVLFGVSAEAMKWRLVNLGLS